MASCVQARQRQEISRPYAAINLLSLILIVVVLISSTGAGENSVPAAGETGEDLELLPPLPADDATPTPHGQPNSGPTTTKTISSSEDSDNEEDYDKTYGLDEYEKGLLEHADALGVPGTDQLLTVEESLRRNAKSWEDVATKAKEQELLMKELETRRSALEERTRALLDQVRDHNVGELGAVLRRLNETMYEELERRDHFSTAESTEDEEADEEEDGIPPLVDEWADSVPPEDRVKLAELESTINPTSILSESESELERWLKFLARKELEKKVGEERKSRLIAKMESKNEDIAQCVTAKDAALMVHSSLTSFTCEDEGGLGGGVGIGRYDHASIQSGGAVVHGPSFTSDTYDPLPTARLGGLSWRKYIPEDWEQLLPEAWESWEVPTGVPSFVYHAFGIRKAPRAPPEVVLSPDTNLGSCWATAGNGGNMISIRLPYPVKIDAVTMDHLPALTGMDESRRNSAPRFFKVLGYPPCLEKGTKEECHKFGFDVSKAIDFGSFEYKLSSGGDGAGGSRSVQTFDVVTKEVGADPPSDDEEGGCDDTACTPPSDLFDNGSSLTSSDEVLGLDDPNVVQGLTVLIEENWGQEDYTCLYRFRVHGERVFP